MQLVVARVAAAGAVVSETSARASLEAARQSAEDQAVPAEAVAATAATEWDSLASKLALSEAEIERLRAATALAEEAAERAKTVAATAETTARDAAQAAVHEKAALEAKVSELESDSRMATTDLVTTSCQFSKVTNHFRWQPRKCRGFRTPTPSCRRTMTVNWRIPQPLSITVFTSCQSLT
jgi:hypothetical protein